MKNECPHGYQLHIRRYCKECKIADMDRVLATLREDLELERCKLMALKKYIERLEKREANLDGYSCN